MRVLVVETQPHVRAALQYLLSFQEDIEVVNVVDSGAGLGAKLAVVKPEILVLDWELPRHGAERLIAVARRLHDPPRVVVLSIRANAEEAVREAGADAFVMKTEAPAILLGVLRSLSPRPTK
jgi:DNA-binding NarL/FixJ family response regulator